MLHSSLQSLYLSLVQGCASLPRQPEPVSPWQQYPGSHSAWVSRCSFSGAWSRARMKRGARPFHLQRPSITFLQHIPGPSPMTPPNWKQRQEVLLYTFSSVTLPAHSLQVPRRGAVICINYSRRGPCIPGTHLSPLHVPSGLSLFSLSSLLSSKEYLLRDSCQLGQSFGGQAPDVCVWGSPKVVRAQTRNAGG